MSFVKLSEEPVVEEAVTLYRVKLGAYTQIQAHCELNNVILGNYSYCAGYNLIDYAEIGKFCSIAAFVRINPGNHPAYQRIAQHHFTYRSQMFGFGEDDTDFFDWRKDAGVTIGNDVWFGHGAVIMPGVKVGNGAVVGSCSVVTKDVEPYSVVVGVPAKKIKNRFDDKLIEKIEASKWWDWDHDRIKERLGDFRDMESFVRKYL